MSNEERIEIIDEVIKAVKSETWSWLESDYEHHLRCKELDILADKLKKRYIEDI